MKEKKQAIQTILFVITFTVLLVYFVNHAGVIVGFFSKIISLLLPFIIGCGIAFVINLPMRGIENSLFKNKDSKLYKHKRTISMLLSYIVVFAFVFLVIFKVVPEVRDTILTITDKLPGFVDKAKNWLIKYTERYPDITAQIMSIEIDWGEVGSMFTNKGGSILSTTISVFSSIISTIVNVSVGFVFSLYILTQKEKLGRQLKMIIYAGCKESTADELMVFGKIANTAFSRFFACQFREGLILGSMFAVSMAIFGMPYPLTVGVLMAFTALIPVFGAFIGCFIGGFLILVDNPSMLIWFIVLFFVIQFIENNFIYPKLVGGDVGLSAIWVLLAVLVGGDLMGVVGMFIFIPLVSVLYAYFRSIVFRKLKKKEIDVDKKEVPDDVMPLMSNKRRMFQMKGRAKDEKETEEAVPTEE
ncbi:MAG: AI-2E family transporter [Lachnospiraceae bacterium]|nr:AI-2E family transporter [Lachnospiraceae bacterium]